MAYQHSITIDIHGRKWTQVTIHYPSGRDGKARTLKDSVSSYKEGDTVTISGRIEKDYTGYGTTTELVVVPEEEMKQEEIQKWITLFREKYQEQGYIYHRAVEELHKLDCHDFDKEIRTATINLAKQKWIGYFRENYRNGEGYIYKRAIEELHNIGCYEFDEEIQTAKDKIAEKKKAEKEAKLQAEKDAGIVTLALPAYRGFEGRPQKGETLMYKGAPYEVISSYYNSQDGFSFGVMYEEWYSVKAKNISATPKGQKMIEAKAKDDLLIQAQRNLEEKTKQLHEAISAKGTRYAGEKISINDIAGEILFDNINIYGGGIMIKYDADTNTVWLIINNGTDGDNWDLNNVMTGGAGAYAFSVPYNMVKKEVADYLAAKKSVI